MHVSYFGHGTLKFRHADPLFLAQHSSFLSCKRNIIKVRGPKTLGGLRTPQQVDSAHLKWVRAPKFVTLAYCFSHCKNIVSVQTEYRGKMWSDEAIYTC